ncbi:MAG: polyprenyl synthetase family protein [Ignisphaera sp.]|nr:polyprenyl synthetase family protein [Ignisphaera sp.]MCX8167818.1 polyprenyl synthetase family protein [Ignisphaera sp.]MDW8085817.1 polyprenyl synthetase family protein [Ignisphaera sp.]
MRFLSYASEVSKKVENFIYDVVKGEPKILYDSALHYIRAGGKRIRPLLTVLSSRMCGGSEDIAIPGAAAVEVLHTFTLVHDDIIDRDEFRRGVPTVHKVWGTDMAIISGDLLYAYAYRCLIRSRDYGVPNDRILRALDALTNAAITVAEGQSLDMLLPSIDNVDTNMYIDMIRKKTAALFASSAAIGAILADGDCEAIEKLKESMINAGTAFQIRDDILGLVGDEKTLGKPIYSDIREGKMTILVIYTLNKVDESKKKRLRSVLGDRKASLHELSEAAEIIRSSGAVEYAESLAEQYAARAIEISRSIDSKDSEALHMFREVVEFMVKRNY